MNVSSEKLDTEGLAGQFLSFTLGGEDYGIDILRVQEIRGWEPVRPLPSTPDYVKGVLDLRGTVVPIIDTRIRFGMHAGEYTPTTVIIVVMVKQGDQQHMVGAVVDAVSDVLDVAPGEVRRPPRLGTQIKTEYITGMIKRDERMVILLDVDHMFDPEELCSINEML